MKSLYKNFLIIRYVFRFCPTYAFFSGLYILSAVVNSVSKVFLIQKAVSLAANEAAAEEILNPLLLYLAVIIITVLIRVFYQNHLSGRYRTIYVQRIQQLMYKKTKSIDYPDFDNPEFYDQYARALRDGSARGIRVYEDMVNFLSSVANTIAIGSIILLSDVYLILMIIAASVVTVIFNITNSRMLYRLDKKTEPNRRMYYYVNRTFYQQKYAAEIKTTSISELLIDKYREHARIMNREHIRTQKKVTVMTLLSNIASILIEQGGTYYILTKKLFAGAIPLSDFTSILSAGLQFSGNFVSAIYFITRVKDNAMYIDDFLWYMNYQPKLENHGTVATDETLDTLTAENLSFSYPERTQKVLDSISLPIRQGEKLAIVGLNGAGKTTLVKLLLKFYQASAGTIYYNHQDYSDLDEESIRKQYAIVFQDFQIYALSIAENVLMRKIESEDDEQRVWDALRKVGLEERVRALPDTIQTMVTREFDDYGVVFSGGEKQKLVIARVFASDAHILILDEPTASLDPIAEKTINDLIIGNAANKTIIIIAHRLSTVVDADRIILMENGKITESGTHQELIEQKGMYWKMFETQASLYRKNI